MKILKHIGMLLAVIIISACNHIEKKNSTIQIISAEEVHQAINNDLDLLLLDVRTSEEFAEGHIPGAQNICVTDDDFEEKVAMLDKEKPVYVYCRSGKRSEKAAGILKDLGFKDIREMEGGILEWDKQNFKKD